MQIATLLMPKNLKEIYISQTHLQVPKAKASYERFWTSKLPKHFAGNLIFVFKLVYHAAVLLQRGAVQLPILKTFKVLFNSVHKQRRNELGTS